MRCNCASPCWELRQLLCDAVACSTSNSMCKPLSDVLHATPPPSGTTNGLFGMTLFCELLVSSLPEAVSSLPACHIPAEMHRCLPCSQRNSCMHVKRRAEGRLCGSQAHQAGMMPALVPCRTTALRLLRLQLTNVQCRVV